MELKKDKWTEQDILEFQEYLKSFENENKREWCKNILKTELSVLEMKTKDIKNIFSKISKGNYLSFLDFMVWHYYENTSINGLLISTINDFDTMKKYLDIYSEKADNWATCDLLMFDIEGREKQFFNLAKEYLKNEKPFVKRIGLNIILKLVDNEEFIDEIFVLLNNFKDEDNYYVNMIIAWILCECFIKQKEKTLKFFENHNLNKFTINKAVQKCRESNRVSLEDKQLLLKFKVK